MKTKTLAMTKSFNDGLGERERDLYNRFSLISVNRNETSLTAINRKLNPNKLSS